MQRHDASAPDHDASAPDLGREGSALVTMWWVAGPTQITRCQMTRTHSVRTLLRAYSRGRSVLDNWHKPGRGLSAAHQFGVRLWRHAAVPGVRARSLLPGKRGERDGRGEQAGRAQGGRREGRTSVRACVRAYVCGEREGGRLHARALHSKRFAPVARGGARLLCNDNSTQSRHWKDTTCALKS